MSGLLTTMAEGQNAWVVFSGQTEISWLKFLRPGFRHCYVLINDGERWTSIDPLSHVTEISVHHHVPVEFDLPGWLQARGNHVVKAPLQRDVTKAAPFMPYSSTNFASGNSGASPSCKRWLMGSRSTRSTKVRS